MKSTEQAIPEQIETLNYKIEKINEKLMEIKKKTTNEEKLAGNLS